MASIKLRKPLQNFVTFLFIAFSGLSQPVYSASQAPINGFNWVFQRNSVVENLLEQGSLDEAKKKAVETLQMAVEWYGIESEVSIFARLTFGKTLLRLIHNQRAISFLEETFRISERVFGSVHALTGLVLSDLAEAHKQANDYRLALLRQEQVLSINEQLFGLEHPQIVVALTSLASINSALEQHQQALKLQVRALAILEKSLGTKNLDIAYVLNNLALTHQALAQYDQALQLQVRALAIVEGAFGADHPTTAIALDNLAAAYFALAQYDEALAHSTRALMIREKLFGAESSHTASSLNNVARILNALGKLDKALVLAIRALIVRENSSGPDHPNTAMALSNLAATRYALAQYDEVLPLQLRALLIFEKALGSEHPYTVTALNNLGATHYTLGQYDNALPLQIRSLSIQDRLSSDHPNTAIALSNLATTYYALEEYEKALPLQLRALQIQEEILGPEHPSTALVLSNLAVTYSALGQKDEALSLELRSLAIRESVLGREHPDTAIALGNLAHTYFGLAENAKAFDLEVRVLSIREKVLGIQHPHTAIAQANLAASFLYLKAEDWAVTLLKSAVNAYQSTRERVSRIGALELQAYTTSVASAYRRLASVLTQQGRLAEAQLVLDMLKEDEQFDFIRRSNSADPRRTRIGYTATEARWMRRYREIADRLAALGREQLLLQKQTTFGLTDEQKKRQASLAADLRVAQAAFESFLEDMRGEFAAQGASRVVEFSESSIKAVAELQGLIRGLGDDVVLLQIYLTEDQVNFLLTTPGVQIARSVRIKTQSLNRQIADLNRLLRDRRTDPLPAAQALYELLIAPVEQDLQQAGARTVMLSLDGVLRYLPFGVLHDGERFALQRWNLPLFTSVMRDRLRDAANPNWQVAGLGVTRRHGEFESLPGVRAEMNNIIRTGGSGVLLGEVYLDEAFTAQRLRDVSQRRFPVVHVASHFRFSPGTEVNSFLLLGDGTQLTLGDIRTQNYRFDDVDLLTLSACETGLGGGRDQRGREIEGFGVIAQQQGARAVLATLWKVADQSTAVLMGDMYRRRIQGKQSRIEALRQAQLALASQPRTSHPFFWAPFVLMGNWK